MVLFLVVLLGVVVVFFLIAVFLLTGIASATTCGAGSIDSNLVS